MREYALTTLTRKLAQTLGRRENVRITFEGQEAHTDGQVITLPALPPGLAINQHQYLVLHGYLDHEITHLRYTDFEQVKKANLAGPIAGLCMNIMEDVRAEGLYIDYYPGAAEGLDAVCDEIEGPMREDLGGEKAPALKELQEFARMFYDLAWSFRGRPRLTDPKMEDLREWEEVTEILTTLPKMKSTKAVTEAAIKIQELVLKRIKLPPEEKKTALKFVPGPGKRDPNAAPTQLTPEGLEKTLKAFQAWVDKVTDNAKIVSKLIQQAKEAAGLDWNPKARSGSQRTQKWGSQALPPLYPDKDRIMVYPRDNYDAYLAVKGTITNELSMTKKSVRIYLRSRTTKATEKGLEQGELDEDAIPGIYAGEWQRTKQEKRERILIDTSLQVLSDLSGSMKRDEVIRMTILITEAMAGIPELQLMSTGFNATGDMFGRGGTHQTKGYGRLNPMNFWVFKHWKDPMRKARTKLGGLSCRGLTPLGDAYQTGLEQMLETKSTRRILWILTDGASCYSAGDQDHDDYAIMRRAHAWAKRRNIETVALILGGLNNFMEGYVDRSVVMADGKQLSKVVLDLAKGLIKTRTA